MWINVLGMGSMTEILMPFYLILLVINLINQFLLKKHMLTSQKILHTTVLTKILAVVSHEQRAMLNVMACYGNMIVEGCMDKTLQIKDMYVIITKMNIINKL